MTKDSGEKPGSGDVGDRAPHRGTPGGRRRPVGRRMLAIGIMDAAADTAAVLVSSESIQKPDASIAQSEVADAQKAAASATSRPAAPENRGAHGVASDPSESPTSIETPQSHPFEALVKGPIPQSLPDEKASRSIHEPGSAAVDVFIQAALEISPEPVASVEDGLRNVPGERGAPVEAPDHSAVAVGAAPGTRTALTSTTCRKKGVDSGASRRTCSRKTQRADRHFRDFRRPPSG